MLSPKYITGLSPPRFLAFRRPLDVKVPSSVFQSLQFATSSPISDRWEICKIKSYRFWNFQYVRSSWNQIQKPIILLYFTNSDIFIFCLFHKTIKGIYFVSNLNLSIQLGEKHILLCKKLKIHVTCINIFNQKSAHIFEIVNLWKITVA